MFTKEIISSSIHVHYKWEQLNIKVTITVRCALYKFTLKTVLTKNILSANLLKAITLNTTTNHNLSCSIS